MAEKTTMNTTGGATIMGSFPYPPNGMIEIDYEHILIFKRPGENIRQEIDIKKKSVMTKEEWKEYFSGHWYFAGTKQVEHQAMFPEELPKRLIKMFSFVGETVLDPFMGSGTTAKVALNLNRNTIGYEINKDFIDVIKKKIGFAENSLIYSHSFDVVHEANDNQSFDEDIKYIPSVQDATFKIDPKLLRFKKNENTYKVVSIENENTLVMDTGLKVKLLGICVDFKKKEELKSYLNRFVLKKEVILKYDKLNQTESKEQVEAYVYLKNKIFINMFIITSGLGKVDMSSEYQQKDNFIKKSMMGNR